MNNSEILGLVFELKDSIINSDLYKLLKEKEKNMINDEECFKLLNLYQSVQEEYNNAKRFEKYGGKVEETQKKLSEIKSKVNENALVIEYNAAYKNLLKELDEIQNILFKDIIATKRKIIIE